MILQFLSDQCVPAEFAETLRRHGHQITLLREVLPIRSLDPAVIAIRTSDGEIRWMDVSAYLKRENPGRKTVRQIVFAGERFDVMSALRWRERVRPERLEHPAGQTPSCSSEEASEP